MGTSGGRIGYENARRILEKGGEERATYLQRFQEENPQYKIQSINHSGEHQALTGQYETESQKIQSQVGITPQHTQNTQEVHKRSENVSSYLNPALSQSMEQFSQHFQRSQPEEKANSPESPESPQTMQQQISTFINNVEKRVNKGQEEVVKHQQELKQAEQEAQKILPKGTTELHDIPTLP